MLYTGGAGCALHFAEYEARGDFKNSAYIKKHVVSKIKNWPSKTPKMGW